MKKILCATDFSDNAANAAKYGATLAKKLNAGIVLAHIYENPIVYTEPLIAPVQPDDGALKQIAEKKLGELKSLLQKDHTLPEIKTILKEGIPSDQLTAIADEENVELIVLGTTGSNRFERLLLGSTCSEIINNAHCPVLCVPKTAKFDGIKKIVFSTDLLEDNIRSATSLTTFAKIFDAEIVFLYVDGQHLIHSDDEVGRVTSKIRSRIRYPKISGYISNDNHVTKGIARFLKKNPADMLVMLTHERHFPETLFHPSLTKMMSHQTAGKLLSTKLSDSKILRKF